jgi:hypothetical protein
VQRWELVGALVESDEWLSRIVTDLYLDTLGRAPDAAGLAFWLGRLRAGVSVASVAARFYSSDEYFDGSGGGTVETWVSDLYEELLGRAVDAGGLAYWTSQVPSRGRGWVAYQLFQSLESRRARVTDLYVRLLDREPDVAGRDYWADRVLTAGDLALAVSLASSEEYLRLSQP